MGGGKENHHYPPGEGNKACWKNMERRVWRSLDTHQMPVLTLVLVGFTLWSIFFSYQGTVDAQTPALTPEDVEKLKQFLAEHNPSGTNFSYDQLKQWFENQLPDFLRFEEYPRLYPFCVTHKLINDEARTTKDDHLYKFKEIFLSMERVDEKFYNFNVTKHSTLHRTDWVKNIQLSRINTPELDMVNLKQWLHIKVETAEKVKGLYMQTIVGPLGLPFGEFYLDFPCKDDESTKDMDKVGQLSYCAYRPRAAIQVIIQRAHLQHPSVYVGYDPNGRTEFHMHFFWTDITCMETPYLQFLMLVVKDFDYNATTKGHAKLDKQYKPLLSPIYLNTAFDSLSGAPFPYYPEWKDNMYCFLDQDEFNATYKKNFPNTTQTDPNDPLNPNKNIFPLKKEGNDAYYTGINWKQHLTTFRIQPNEAYDSCITGNRDDPTHAKRKLELRDELRLECPPGPFRCDSAYKDTGRDQVGKDREMLVTEEERVSECTPCGAPNCEEIGFPEHKCDFAPDEIKYSVNESTELNTVEGIIRAKSHGIQAMFAFLVMIPISNFMGRFYKDVCGKCFCDNGPWIFVHIISHVLSLLFMWISVGPVIPKLAEFDSVKKECKSQFPDSKKKFYTCVWKASYGNPHLSLATAAFLMQHLLVGLGFWHSKNDTFRKIQVILHSHFGYFCWLLGAAATILATHDDACHDLFAISTFLFVTPFIFSALAVSLDCLTDKKVGIMPPRRQWPVFEGVKLEGRGPLTIPKWILFAAFTGVMVFAWLLALGTSLTIIGSTDSLFVPVTPGKNENPKISSIFGGDCSGGQNLVGQASQSFVVKNKTEG